MLITSNVSQPSFRLSEVNRQKQKRKLRYEVVVVTPDTDIGNTLSVHYAVGSLLVA